MSFLEQAVDAIRRAKPREVVFFTGAGVSAESGIPTFRGAGGLWRNFRAEDLATPEAFARDPELVLEWYDWRRGLIRAAEPNAAHLAIARMPDAPVVTQNVDGLHARAGSRNVIELHGNIFRERPMGNRMRPDVVWFGEMLPADAVERATEAIRRAELLLVIGTSGVVYPAAGLVSFCRGLSIEINPQASGVSSACAFAIPMTAANATPPIVDAILEGR
jgi:NAD-dependent deacetylase